MIGLLAVYIIVFIVLVIMQFTKQGNFTRRMGNLMVSGQYRIMEASERSLGFNEQALAGPLVLSFRGMEFRIDEASGFRLVSSDGTKTAVLPASMTIADETLLFRLPDDTKLSFSLRYEWEVQELVINATLADGVESLELPYRPLKSSLVQQREDGQFTLIADGLTYGFSRMALDRQVLVLSNAEPLVSYLVIPEAPAITLMEPTEEPVFNPADFVIDPAYEPSSFNTAVGEWRAQVSTIWSRTSVSDEGQVVASESEAIRRGNYRQTSASVPSSFLNGNQRTFESSVYFGRMSDALRSLSASERDTLSRLSQSVSERSLGFFREPHAIEYLSIRGSTAVVDAAAAWIRSIDPSALTPDLIPGILEGYTDWSQYRPTADNPFTRFNERIFLLASAGIRKTAAGDKVFVFNNGAADMAFNVRLGKALIAYADATGDASWAAAGRSMVLSVLSLTDNAATLPNELLISDVLAGTSSSSSATRVSAASIYRLLALPSLPSLGALGENYPHISGLNAGGQTIWTLTAASSVSTVTTTNSLDISVSFPVGETHYMLIRGVRLPARLQLYNIDYRTAVNFESYDSSGWSYSASEQTLLVKMRHRTQVEHIRIFW
jgi:hypothetical protein